MQCFDRRYKSVMKSLTGSPFSGLRLLGHALSKIISLDFVEHSFPFLSAQGKNLESGHFVSSWFTLLGSAEVRISQMAFFPRSGMGCHHVIVVHSIE